MNTINNVSPIFQARKLIIRNEANIENEWAIWVHEFPKELRSMLEKSPVIEKFIKETPQKTGSMQKLSKKLFGEKNEILEVLFQLKHDKSSNPEPETGHIVFNYSSNNGKPGTWMIGQYISACNLDGKTPVIETIMEEFNKIKDMSEFLGLTKK